MIYFMNVSICLYILYTECSFLYTQFCSSFHYIRSYPLNIHVASFSNKILQRLGDKYWLYCFQSQNVRFDRRIQKWYEQLYLIKSGISLAFELRVAFFSKHYWYMYLHVDFKLTPKCRFSRSRTPTEDC